MSGRKNKKNGDFKGGQFDNRQPQGLTLGRVSPLIGGLVVLGAVFWLRWRLMPRVDLPEGRRVRVVGVVSEEPTISGTRQRLRVDQFEFWTERYPEFHYGEKVEIEGRIKLKKEIKFLGVSYKQYVLTEAEVKKVEQKNLINLAANFRLKLGQIFEQGLSVPYDGILAGVVLGDKKLIGKDFWEKLKKTGTLHIMVASGMNIAMISEGILKVLVLFFKRRVAIVFLVILIWFYSIMTGFSAPIVRAVILATFVYWGNFLGREVETKRILWLTGLLMILANPLFVWEVGFQLSFLATVGLVYWQPVIKRLGEKKGLGILKLENFSSSLATQLMTLPVLATRFGDFNFLSPFTNLIILWAIPFVLQGGILVSLLGILWTRLAFLAVYLIFPFLWFIEQTIDFFAKIDFLTVGLPQTEAFWAIWYLILAAVYWWLKRKEGLKLRK